MEIVLGRFPAPPAPKSAPNIGTYAVTATGCWGGLGAQTPGGHLAEQALVLPITKPYWRASPEIHSQKLSTFVAILSFSAMLIWYMWGHNRPNSERSCFGPMGEHVAGGPRRGYLGTQGSGLLCTRFFCGRMSLFVNFGTPFSYFCGHSSPTSGGAFVQRSGILELLWLVSACM